MLAANTVADYQKAFALTVHNEGSDGAITPDPTHDDQAAYARLGINSHWHPEAVAEGFYKMPIEQALAWAENLYKYRYWVPVGGYQIACQDIADKFFDLAVNEGCSQATKIVQRAVNHVLYPVAVGYIPLAVDGHCGAHTSEAINACAPEELLPAIKDYASQFYRDVANREKWPARELAALLSRVAK